MAKQLTNHEVSNTVSAKHSVEVRHVERPVMDDVFSDAYSFEELDNLAMNEDFIRDLDSAQSKAYAVRHFPSLVESIEANASQFDSIGSEVQAPISYHDALKFYDTSYDDLTLNIKDSQNFKLTIVKSESSFGSSRRTQHEVFRCENGIYSTGDADAIDKASKLYENLELSNQDVRSYVTGVAIKSIADKDSKEMQPVIEKVRGIMKDSNFESEDNTAGIRMYSHYDSEIRLYDVEKGEDLWLRSREDMIKLGNFGYDGYSQLKSNFKQNVNERVAEQRRLMASYESNPEGVRKVIENQAMRDEKVRDVSNQLDFKIEDVTVSRINTKNGPALVASIPYDKSPSGTAKVFIHSYDDKEGSKLKDVTLKVNSNNEASIWYKNESGENVYESLSASSVKEHVDAQRDINASKSKQTEMKGAAIAEPEAQPETQIDSI